MSRKSWSAICSKCGKRSKYVHKDGIGYAWAEEGTDLSGALCTHCKMDADDARFEQAMHKEIPMTVH